MFNNQGSWETEFLKFIEFYLEDGFGMAIHWWHCGDCMFIVQVSWETEVLSWYNNFNSEDILKMTMH